MTSRSSSLVRNGERKRAEKERISKRTGDKKS
jgi:hypothetical protein